jgi:DNA end-binding protein Ku
LFQRVRTVLIRPYLTGLFASTLKFDYEVFSARDAFARLPKTKVSDEALDLAKHIIKTKQETFDPADFHDRYEAELAELVNAQLEGKTIKAAKPPPKRSVHKTILLLRATSITARSLRRRTKHEMAAIRPSWPDHRCACLSSACGSSQARWR